MRMADMNIYLEERGFEVDRYYERDTNLYRFTISKNDKHARDSFEYPANVSDAKRDHIQRKFMNDLIKQWDDCFGKGENPYCDEFASNNRKDKYMNPKHFDNILINAAMNRHTGYIQIDGARIPVRISTWKGSTSDELAAIECDVLVPEQTFSYKNYFHANYDEVHHLIDEGKREFLSNMLNSKYGASGQYGPQIKDVIFNNPATIILWQDGTKTVVKAEGEEYDPEKGLAMAIAKKTMGNKHDYYITFKKWLKRAAKKDAK